MMGGVTNLDKEHWMGKLRMEPKHKNFLSDDKYNELLSVLKEGQRASVNSHVFWDLEAGEKASAVKKMFTYVAAKAGIEVIIRQVRGTNSLAFYYKKGRTGGTTRMSSADSRNRILECLRAAKQPMKKNHIIRETGISASTWNIRIKELLKEGSVKRQGDRRDTTYTNVS